MTEGQAGVAAVGQAGGKFTARDGAWIATGVIALAVAVGVVLWVLGAWNWLVRRTVPVLLEWPGGSWGFGVLCGLVTVVGGVGVLGFFGSEPGDSRLRRSGRSAGLPVCVVVAYGPFVYMLSALPGRHCSSSESQCRYMPGTGSAFLAYVVTVALVGWILWRVLSARVEVQAVRERARMKKLRKKGKGKSRAARQR